MTVFEVPTYVTTIPLPAAITTGSGVQSYTDPNGEVWVAANGVNGGAWRMARQVLHCAYYRNAAFTIPTTAAALIMDTSMGDDYSMYSMSSGLFTAPIAGWWRITQSMGAGSTGACWIQLAASGSQSAVGTYAVGHGSVASVTVWTQTTGLYRFTVGQTAGFNMNGSASLTGRNNASNTKFEADYLGTG